MDATLRLAAFLANHGMPTELSEIRREHFESFIADQLDHFKATTAHNRYRGCQAFFRWAVDEGLVKESPMARTKPPRLPEAPPAILREPELRALLGVCEADKSFAGIRDAALVRIFLDTGARRAEISNLRYDPSDDMANDVDLDQALIRVLGKGRRERIVPIGNKTIRAVDRYLRLRGKHQGNSQPWLWLGLKGRLTDSGIAQAIRERGIAAGLGSKVHPRQLRQMTSASSESARTARRRLRRTSGSARRDRDGHRHARHERDRGDGPNLRAHARRAGPDPDPV
jgi:site-specific recombinase XerD